MKTRSFILFFPLLSVIAVSVLLRAHAARTEARAAPALAPKESSEGVTANWGLLTIPDTTLAINSSQPMSQRVVH